MQGELRWEESELERIQTAALDEILDEYEAEPNGAGMLKMLRGLGFPVTQPSVSRDPQQPGTVRSGESDPLPSWIERADESPLREVQGLILTVATVKPWAILVNTKSGAGPAVAAAIDASDWWDVLAGTSAGTSSVLLITENKSFQDLVMHRLKFFHVRYGRTEGKIERQPFHE